MGFMYFNKGEKIMKSILVITSSKDSIADYIMAIYAQKCLFFRFDLDRISDYNFQLNQYGWSIDNYKEFITDKSIDAIYYRKPIFPNYIKYSDSFQSSMRKDIDLIIKGITNAFEGKCLNKPEMIERAENKVYQMYLAQKIGFRTTESLITNSLRSFDKFYQEENSLIHSPLSVDRVDFSNYIGGRFYSLINSIGQFEGLEIKPIYFEKKIEEDYRVIANFISKKSYVARLDIEYSDGKNIKVSSLVLPKEIEEKCITFMEQLGLEFITFSFIVKNDKYYFLEISPNAQWLWLENEFGWGLSHKIVEYLCS